MMYSEFFQRTKIEVSYDEYHYVEESYYEFDGDKDEFCKAWVKDYKSGVWARELRLRRAADKVRREMQAKIDEQAEALEFYRSEYKKGREAMKKVAEAQERVEALRASLGRFAAALV